MVSPATANWETIILFLNSFLAVVSIFKTMGIGEETALPEQFML